MTEAVDRGTLGDAQSIEVNYVLQPTAGATGTKTATAASGADPGVAHILALRPAPQSLTISRPAGAVPNDVLIASVGFRPSTATINTPAGWTLVRRTDNPAAPSSSLAVFRKVVGSSEPSAYSWDVAGAVAAAGGIQAFANVDIANPINAESGQATPASLSHSTPSITSTVSNVMIVTAHGLPSATTWSPPTGMTEGFDLLVAGQHSVEANYVVQPAAAATGAKTATAAAGANPGNAHILALRPAAPAVAQLYFIHVDHLNTPRLVANSTGTTVWRWDQLEPFGSNPADQNPSGLGALDLPLRFAGQTYDAETGLHYNYYRDFDPSLGTYKQSDLIGLHGGVNTYAYVDGNPISYTDPLGLAGGGAAPGTAGNPLPPRGWTPPRLSENYNGTTNAMREMTNFPNNAPQIPPGEGGYPGINFPWALPPMRSYCMVCVPYDLPPGGNVCRPNDPPPGTPPPPIMTAPGQAPPCKCIKWGIQWGG
jgi:RHS repeat-associated protein